jgi:hypothetical protein
MTLAMPDSIYPANLPAGYPAYLGYADGNWPTAPELIRMFPGAHVISLTVSGDTLACDGIDCEPGNPDAAASAAWVHNKLVLSPGFRPVVYASVAGASPYGMPDVLRELEARNIPRAEVRLLSAHYTMQAHICGPASCGAISIDMDGTQWTDMFPGNNGQAIDMSRVHDSFFPAPTPPSKGDTMRLPPAPGDWGPTTQQFFDYQNRIIIVGPNAGNAIYVTISADNGATWSTPVRV